MNTYAGQMNAPRSDLPPARPTIQGELEQIEMALEGLHNSMNVLGTSLNAVSTRIPPKEVVETKANCFSGGPILIQIQRIKTKIHEIMVQATCLERELDL